MEATVSPIWTLAVITALCPMLEVDSQRFTFAPSDCLPMSDESYAPHRHKGLEKELVDVDWDTILFCKYDCCGDGTNNGIQCCPANEESGLSSLMVVSIVAAGIVALAVITLFSVHYIKANNKKRRLVADIQSLQRANMSKSKKTKKIKVGEYKRTPGEGNFHQQQAGKNVGNIFVTRPALPAITFGANKSSILMTPPLKTMAPPPNNATPDAIDMNFPQTGPNLKLLDSSGFTLIPQPAPIHSAGAAYPSQTVLPTNVHPDEEVLKSLIANLPGPKRRPAPANIHGLY